MTKRLFAGLLLLSASLLLAQNASVSAPAADTWKPLQFLMGTWEAKTQGGSAVATTSGTYTFQLELRGHVLARHSTNDGCKGPTDFDCEHGDLLYVYQESPGRPLKAIYFDNEGHVIVSDVTTASPNIAIFVSPAAFSTTPESCFREAEVQIPSRRTILDFLDRWKIHWKGFPQVGGTNACATKNS
jgi:hypothetical protein